MASLEFLENRRFGGAAAVSAWSTGNRDPSNMQELDFTFDLRTAVGLSMGLAQSARG
jgi:hypothetical protein